MKIKVIILTILFQNLLSKENTKTISTINLLLPVNKNSEITYLISAYNGCYEWISSNPSILSIKPSSKYLNEDCVSEAIITVEAKDEYSNIVWIQAKDKQTGKILNCEAKIASIQRLEILTKQKTILVGDLETLELLAYDKEGNVFSTLEGMKFDWKIFQQSRLAEFLTFKEALKKTTEKRHSLEQFNYQTDIVIVKGIETGEINVKTMIMDDFYSRIFTDVNLFIIEHFMIFPKNTVYFLPCDKISFKLFKLKTKENEMNLESIKLPNNKYGWEFGDNQFGELKSDGTLEIKSKIGQTFIQVHDTINKNNKIKNQVFIVQPWDINVYITEYSEELNKLLQSDMNVYYDEFDILKKFSNNWNLLVGQKYIIKAVAIDERGNFIHFQDYKVNFFLNTLDFTILQRNNNLVIVNTERLSSLLKIEAELKGSECYQFSLKTFKNYQIISPIKIIRLYKNDLFLPYYPNQNQQQIYQFFCIGGSQDYNWNSSNENFAQINQIGLLTVIQPGQITVKCLDKHNQQNFDEITIKITPVDKTNFLETKKESKKNKINDIFYQALDQNNNFFANCTSIETTVDSPNELNFVNEKISYENIIKKIKKILSANVYSFSKIDLLEKFSERNYQYYLNEKLISLENLQQIISNYSNYGICQLFEINPIDEGLYNFQIKYQNQPQTLPIKVYDDYIVHKPEGFSQEKMGDLVVIAVNSSARFILEKGVKSWNLSEKTNHRIFKDSKIYNVQITEINDSKIQVEVLCKDISKKDQEELEIISSNSFDKDLLLPVSTTAKINFICADFKTVKLYKKISDQFNPLRYFNEQEKEIQLSNNGEHELSYWLYDEKNRPFWNFTSVDNSWEFNGQKFGSLQPGKDSQTKILTLNEEQGPLNLKILALNEYKLNNKFPSVEDQIQINSFKSLRIQPENQILYLHPQNKVKFKIINGSGNFDIQLDDPEKADFKFLPNSNEIEITPKKEGTVKVKVLDKNQQPSQTFESEIEISKIDEIQIKADKNLHLLGSEITPNIKFFEKSKEIPQEQLKHIKVNLKSTNPNIDINQKNLTLNPKSSGTYFITGEIENEKVNSNILELNVFDKIEVYPKTLYLYPGCYAFFQIFNGPTQKQMQQNGYQLQIEDLENFGKITEKEEKTYQFTSEKLGEKWIKIVLLGEDKKLISFAVLKVIVNIISGLIIKGSDLIHQGAETRFFAIPQIQNNHITVSNCKLNFKIQNSSEQILQISNKFQEKDNIVEKFSILGFDVKGIQQGEGKVEVILKQGSQEFRSSVQITVIAPHNLPLSGYITQEPCQNSYILLQPNATLELDSLQDKFEYEIVQKDFSSQLNVPRTVVTHQKIGNDILIIKNEEKMISNSSVISVENPFLLVAENSSKYIYVNNHSQITIKIKYLDKFGRLFSNAKTQNSLQLLNTNPEIVDSFLTHSYNEINISSKKVGKTNIFIQSIQNPHLFDIFEINVGQLIQPEGKLKVHVGDQIQFTSVNIFEKLNWASDNPIVLQIDQNGKATALLSGKANILFNNSLYPAAQVEVNEIKYLKSQTSNPPKITNIKNHKDFSEKYEFYFDGYNDIEIITLKEIEQIQNRFQVKCNLDNNQLNVKQINKKEKIVFGCEISFNSDYNSLLQNVKLQINIGLLNNANFRISYELNIPIITQFYPKEEIKNLNLTKQNNKKKLEFKTNYPLDFKINSNYTKYFTQKFELEKNIHIIEIEIPDFVDKGFQEELTIYCPQTEEQKQITLYYEQSQSLFSLFNFSMNLNMNFLDWAVIIICIIFILVIYKCWSKEEVDPYKKLNNSSNFTQFSQKKQNPTFYSNPKNEKSRYLNDSLYRRKDIYSPKRLGQFNIIQIKLKKTNHFKFKIQQFK